MHDLIFVKDTHEYILNGISLPSVTEAIKPLGDDLDDYPELENVFENARERGTVCHRIIELILNGADEAGLEYPSEYDGYVDAIRLFFNEHTVVPYAIEKPIASAALMLAGTPDLLCEYDGETTLIDYKFVSQVAKSKVKAQLNAYKRIYEEQNVFIDKLLVVQFLPNGTYRLYDTAVDSTGLDHCLGIVKEKNKKHRRGRID